jgi:NADPH-dependent 7-cyano-7-deazaguanine reductase QueF
MEFVVYYKIAYQVVNILHEDCREATFQGILVLIYLWFFMDFTIF